MSDIERWIRRDPAGRGILSRSRSMPIEPCAGHLAAAADELATQADYVAIITGFYVPDASTPSAETDGPLGAILLADVLLRLGIETAIVTDQLCRSALRAAMTACGVEAELHVSPVDREASSHWQETFWISSGQRVTHLISTERVGPSLHDESETALCRNVRGVPIDEWSADLYRLFEDAPQHVRTIGIGDGGNEIGMGTFWSEIAASEPPPLSACRTTTDWTILAGVSDWGAMALATSFSLHQSETRPLSQWTGDRILHGLEQMVRCGPAVDGITLRAESTVDGLPFATYIQPWELMCRRLG